MSEGHDADAPESVLQAFIAAHIAKETLELDAFLAAQETQEPGLRIALEQHAFVARGLQQMQAREPRPPHPARIGPYRIDRVLGQGGMGMVYLAEQELPVRRRAAVKLVKLGMDSERVLRRFEGERQTLASMQHGHIARIFDAGTSDRGQPWFAMEYVDGETITAYCDRVGASLWTRLELFAQVCAGVQHAHQRGVIHRDLKPSNVLVTEEDGAPIAKIIDFGLAKATRDQDADESLFTLQGQVLGTPEYMSPEQTGLGDTDLDTRTDIYSLGVLLYELLTGELPISRSLLRSGGLRTMQRLRREHEIRRPSQRAAVLGAAARVPARLLQGEIDWIVLRALAFDREERYATAADFAADLRRFRDHEPVHAGPPSRLYVAKKFLRRHRGPVTATLAVFVAMATGLVVALRQAELARASQERTETALAQRLEMNEMLQRLADFRTEQPLRPGERRSEWVENFDSQPGATLELQPRRWTHGKGHAGYDIERGADPEGNGTPRLRLQGDTKSRNAAILAHPIDPVHLRHVAEFELRFLLRWDEAPPDSMDLGSFRVDVCDDPSWRQGPLGRQLLVVDDLGRLALNRGEVETGAGAPEPPRWAKGIWHALELRYRCLPGARAEVSARLNGRPLPPVRDSLRPSETNYAWLRFGASSGPVWLDDIRCRRIVDDVERHVRLREGHYFFASDRPLTWHAARAEARRLGGRLAVVPCADDLDTIGSALDFGSFWIGLHRAPGGDDWTWADGGVSAYRHWDPDLLAPPEGVELAAYLGLGESTGQRVASHRRYWRHGPVTERRFALFEAPALPQRHESAPRSELGADGAAHATLPPPPGSLHWARSLGGRRAWQVRDVADVVVNGDEILVVAQLRPSAVLGRDGPEPLLVEATSAVGVLLARFDADGRLLGAHSVTCLGDVQVHRCAAAPDGGVYLCGESTRAPGEGFVAQLTRSGALGWQHRLVASEGPLAVCAIDAAEGAGIALAGCFRGRLELAGGTCTSHGGDDAFVARFDPQGRLLWLRSHGTAGQDAANGVALAPDGSVWMAGHRARPFASPVEHDNPYGLVEAREIWALRHAPDGALAWVRILPATGIEGFAVDVDAHASGACVLTGGFRGLIRVPGPHCELLAGCEGRMDVFVTVLEPDGAPRWLAKVSSAVGNDLGQRARYLEDGSVLVTGRAGGIVRFDSSQASHLRRRVLSAHHPLDPNAADAASNSLHDAFAAAFDDLGGLLWARLMGGPDHDQGTGIAALPCGDPVLVGTYIGPAVFGRGDARETTLLAGTMFLARLRR